MKFRFPFLIAAVCGCVSPPLLPTFEGEDVVRFRGLNPRVRPDREPLDGLQDVEPLGGTYRDGGPSGKDLVSLVRPLSMDERGDGMVQSDCLWVGSPNLPSEVVEVNWEVMVEVSKTYRDLVGFAPDQVGACRLMEPLSGEQFPLFSNGGWIGSGPQTWSPSWQASTTPPPSLPFSPMEEYTYDAVQIPEDVESLCVDQDCRVADWFLEGTLVTAREVLADPDGHCIDDSRPTAETVLPEFATADPSSVHPFLFLGDALPNCSPAGACGDACEWVPTADSILEIQPAQVFAGQQPAPWPDGSFRADPFPTNLMVVDKTRTIVRRMEVQPNGRAVWHTPVQVFDDGSTRWEENFTDRIAVSKVRIYERSGGYGKWPLPLDGAELVISGPGNSRGVVTCPLDSVGVVHEADVQACAEAFATPTAWIAGLAGPSLDRPMQWSVDVPAEPNQQIMIEFELAAIGSRVDFLIPDYVEFDDTEAGADRQQWVTVESVGDRHGYIGELRVTGPDAEVFQVRVPEGPVVPPGAAGNPVAAAPAPSDRAMPFRVAADGAFSVLVTASPPAGGAYEATLEVHTLDDYGNTEVVRTPLRVQGLDLSFETFPTSRVWDFATGPGWSDPRAVFLVNSGHVDIERFTYEIVGDDAHHFEVLAPTDEHGFVTPGNSDEIVVQYTPSCAPPFPIRFDGFRHAELVVETDRGFIRWPLAGSDGPLFVCQTP